MTLITLRVRDHEQPQVVTIEPGMALLVGRAPDPARIERARRASRTKLRNEPILEGFRIQLLRLDSARVSANHLLITSSSDGGTVSMWDLGSRNGSWLRLSEGQPVSVAGGLDVVADLAGVTASDPRISTPRDADWTSEKGFGTAVVQALADWLRKLGVLAEILIVSSGSDEAGVSSFQLADDTALRVQPPAAGTQDVMWPAILEQIRVYVHEQNTRYEQYQKRVDGMIVASRGLRDALRKVADAAAQGRRAILLGETGVGKDWLARCYHRYSQRHSGPFAALNCALLDRELLYAQLFGARRGSFTGAVTDVVGVVEAAHEGTLFHNKHDKKNKKEQKTKQRFLDSRGEYQRLGDPRPRRADVQIVCATNAPLDSPEARIGRFRDDLWYRLAASVIAVPPQRERREDILANLHNRPVRNSNTRVADALTAEALERVLSDPWPGNFRDLDNFVERLPPISYSRGLDLATVEEALSEGRSPRRLTGSEVVQRESTKSRRRNSDSLTGTGDLDWRLLAVTAVEAFVEDHGVNEASWGQLQEFIEKYLKPVFVAHASDLRKIDELGKTLNYSALARRLNIADGSTIKMHLGRYIERFRVREGSK